MIEDLDDAAPEPTRRQHVVALSAATAVVSLVLLMSLLAAPAEVGTLPYAALPAPSASLGPFTTTVSFPLSQLRIDLSRTSTCRDGTKLVPPYHLTVDATTGRITAVISDPRTDRSVGRSVPVALAWDARASHLTVTCATDDGSVPRDIVVR